MNPTTGKIDDQKAQAILTGAHEFTTVKELPKNRFEMITEGYESLAAVLECALDQAAIGKGSERHAQDAPFDQQPMQKLIELYGVGFALGQAGKKMQESQRMDNAAAVRELLGAINYAAGAVVYLTNNEDK